MFDNYVGAKLAKRPRWVSLVIGLSIFLHAGAGAALVIRSFWVIDKLAVPEQEIGFAVAAPPPPPPPAGSSKPHHDEQKKVVHKTKDLVQPDPDKKPEQKDTSESKDEGEEGGVEGGVAGGVVGGVLGGVEGGVLGADKGPPPPPEEPKIVPQVALEQQRISGEKMIEPPNDVATQVSRSGKPSVGVIKMCLSAGGGVSKLQVLKSTGYPTYDAKLKSKMMEWKYRPFMVNGKAVPVCTSVTFIYHAAK